MDFREAFNRLKRFIKTVIRNAMENQVFFRATSLAFTTVLSIVPLTMVFFSFGGFDQFNFRIIELLGKFLLPERGDAIIALFVSFTENAGKLGATGSILFFLSALMLLNAMEKHLNTIFRTKPHRVFLRRAGTYVASLVLISFLFAAGLGPVSGMLDAWNRVSPPGRRVFGIIISIFGAMAGMMFIFGLVSSARVRIRSSLIGSFIGALSFQAAKYGFTFWASHSVRHSVIYGSVVFLPLLLIWMNLAWIIILVTAEITQAHQSRAGLFHRPTPDTPADETELGWRIYLSITEGFRRGKRPPSAQDLADALRADDRMINTLLARMETAELIRPVDIRPRGFVPARPPEDQPTAQVIVALAGWDSETSSPLKESVVAGFGEVSVASYLAGGRKE